MGDWTASQTFPEALSTSLNGTAPETASTTHRNRLANSNKPPGVIFFGLSGDLFPQKLHVLQYDLFLHIKTAIAVIIGIMMHHGKRIGIHPSRH